MSITFIKKNSSYFRAAAEFGAERVVKVTRVRTFLSASGARGRNWRSQMIKQLSAVRSEGGWLHKYSIERGDMCGRSFKPVDEAFLNRIRSAPPITNFNKSRHADRGRRLRLRRSPPQLTGGHANNPGQQGGDECSESKIDLPVCRRANSPPHALVLLLLPCMVISRLCNSASTYRKNLTAFKDLDLALQVLMGCIATKMLTLFLVFGLYADYI